MSAYSLLDPFHLIYHLLKLDNINEIEHFGNIKDHPVQ
jgi:hypothetical protein